MKNVGVVGLITGSQLFGSLLSLRIYRNDMKQIEGAVD